MNLKKWPARGWVGVRGKTRKSMASIPLDKFSRDRRVAARNKRAERAILRLHERKGSEDRKGQARKVRRRKSVEETVVRTEDERMMVRQRLIAASYRNGKRDFTNLFRHYDRNNNGNISVKEFLSLVRRDGKVARSMMSDQELELMFVEDVDRDGNGTIEYSEFEAWILNHAGSPLQG